MYKGYIDDTRHPNRRKCSKITGRIQRKLTKNHQLRFLQISSHTDKNLNKFKFNIPETMVLGIANSEHLGRGNTTTLSVESAISFTIRACVFNGFCNPVPRARDALWVAG